MPSALRPVRSELERQFGGEAVADGDDVEGGLGENTLLLLAVAVDDEVADGGSDQRPGHDVARVVIARVDAIRGDNRCESI